MKKQRLFPILLAAVLILSLAACAGTSYTPAPQIDIADTPVFAPITLPTLEVETEDETETEVFTLSAPAPARPAPQPPAAPAPAPELDTDEPCIEIADERCDDCYFDEYPCEKCLIEYPCDEYPGENCPAYPCDKYPCDEYPCDSTEKPCGNIADEPGTDEPVLEV
ncbi:MAG: hypothetical protein FWE08_02345 [Oscillospiraceae bacterium]|nr:hypothetical protein [Oscillospiraceae bacterium]